MLRAGARPRPAPRSARAKEHADFARDLDGLRVRHGGDQQALNAATLELYRERKLEPAVKLAPIARAVALGLAISELNKRVRRRLAPTTVVLARRR